MSGLPPNHSDAARRDAVCDLVHTLESGLRSRKFTVQAMPGRAEVIDVESGGCVAQIGMVDLSDRDALVNLLVSQVGCPAEDAHEILDALFSREVDRAR